MGSCTQLSMEFLYPFRRVPPRESSANVGHCLDDPRSESTPTHFRYFSAAGETLSNTRLSKPLKTNAQVTQCLFAHTQNFSPSFRSPSKYLSKQNRHGQEKSRKKKKPALQEKRCVATRKLRFTILYIIIITILSIYIPADRRVSHIFAKIGSTRSGTPHPGERADCSDLKQQKSDLPCSLNISQQ